MVVKAGESDVPMLVLDDFIVKFWPETTRQQIDVLNAGNAVEVVEKNPYRENQFLLRVTAQSPGDAMAIANRYHESWLTEYAHPDFVAPIDSRARLLDDELLAEQWHHNNTGQDNGTPDADMDTPEAWEITTGSPEVVIAVIDHGFDVNHPDLIENLWVNERELTGASNTDDDGNHFIDDLHGWNFQTNTSTPLACRHGTAAAGCAGARGNNGIGACGSCPDCRLMLLEYGDGIYGKTYAIDYARANGADIISNSWGFWSNAFPGVFPDLEDALREAANQGRGGLGCVVFFAMTNDEVDNGRPGDAAYDISALDEVIAVSASTNNDRKRRPAGYGNSMDILSPTNGGTRCITTTDNRDFLLHLCNRIDHVGCGYNCGGSAGCQGPDPQPNNGEYTFCFTGTSAACPIAAGVGGLVLSAAPDLTRVEVQRLLQDTADKIEPSVASYSPVNGFSLGKKGIATHGYGRINAFEAVRTVGPKDKGGRAGVDLFLRDNDLDWGNTEQPSSTLFEPTRGFLPYWESPDIKIDPDCGAEVPALGIGAFAALDYKKNPKAGKTNGIYVRVRNRGPRPASGVVVTLYWCLAEPNQEPDLPDRFWDEATGNSWDTTPWKPLGASPIGMLHYSGSSVAGSYGDDAEIASFRFSPGLDQTGPCCLLAVVHSDQDPVSDNSKRRVKLRGITPYDNNVTQRAVVIGGSE
jgi:subtilisin family serine protease